LLTIAGIPRRLAYCRENPYHLLSHWIPDPEPYRYIRHQVRRDLELVAAIGAHSTEQKLAIHLPQNYEKDVKTKLTDAGVDSTKPWLIMHPGVSEKKREYPAELWMETGKKIATGLEHQIIITGSKAEK